MSGHCTAASRQVVYEFDRRIIHPEHVLAFLRLHRNGVAEFHYTLY